MFRGVPEAARTSMLANPAQQPSQPLSVTAVQFWPQLALQGPAASTGSGSGPAPKRQRPSSVGADPAPPPQHDQGDTLKLLLAAQTELLQLHREQAAQNLRFKTPQGLLQHVDPYLRPTFAKWAKEFKETVHHFSDSAELLEKYKSLKIAIF